MRRDDEPKSVLEDVARLERENAELRMRVDEARTQLAEMPRPVKPSTSAHVNNVRFAAAISFGLAFGLVTLAVTMLLMPPAVGGAHHEVRGGSAGVCR